MVRVDECLYPTHELEHTASCIFCARKALATLSCDSVNMTAAATIFFRKLLLTPIIGTMSPAPADLLKVLGRHHSGPLCSVSLEGEGRVRVTVTPGLVALECFPLAICFEHCFPNAESPDQRNKRRVRISYLTPNISSNCASAIRLDHSSLSK